MNKSRALLGENIGLRLQDDKPGAALQRADMQKLVQIKLYLQNNF